MLWSVTSVIPLGVFFLGGEPYLFDERVKEPFYLQVNGWHKNKNGEKAKFADKKYGEKPAFNGINFWSLSLGVDFVVTVNHYSCNLMY